MVKAIILSNNSVRTINKVVTVRLQIFFRNCLRLIEIEEFTKSPRGPPIRDLAFELVVVDHGAAGGAVGFAGEVGLAEGGGLGGAQREIILHEPVVIQQLRHPLQLRVDPVVEFDLGV